MVPRLRVASRQMPVGMWGDGRREFRSVATLETHVLVRVVLMSASVAILGIAALQHAPGPRATAGRRGARVQNVLVRVLLAVIVAEDRRVVRAAAPRVRERLVAVAGQRTVAAVR